MTADSPEAREEANREDSGEKLSDVLAAFRAALGEPMASPIHRLFSLNGDAAVAIGDAAEAAAAAATADAVAMCCCRCCCCWWYAASGDRCGDEAASAKCCPTEPAVPPAPPPPPPATRVSHGCPPDAPCEEASSKGWPVSSSGKIIGWAVPLLSLLPLLLLAPLPPPR